MNTVRITTGNIIGKLPLARHVLSVSQSLSPLFLKLIFGNKIIPSYRFGSWGTQKGKRI